jgi:adenosine kinase
MTSPSTIVVSGSIASDHLMVFPGRFAEQLIADQLDHVSLSFLVDELEIRHGGVAANITFGLGYLGMHPILVGAVGEDFADYRDWLEAHNVQTEHVHVSSTRKTARFLCTTDSDNSQIASFYAGAMAEAESIDLGPILASTAGTPLVVVSPDTPEAMLRHTRSCRDRGVPFIADPSQQLARMRGGQIRDLVDGARYLVTNEYERSLLCQKTAWSEPEVLARVGSWITTLGAQGVMIETRGQASVFVDVVPETVQADPTGVGDAFRAGFLTGDAHGLEPQRCAQFGCTLATFVLETVGPQEYTFTTAEFVQRLAAAYGPVAGAEVEACLGSVHADALAAQGA